MINMESPVEADSFSFRTKLSFDPGMFEYFWNHGPISDTTHEKYEELLLCCWDPEGCEKAWDEANLNEVGDINGFNIYVRQCVNKSMQARKEIYRNSFKFIHSFFLCKQDLMCRNGNEFCMETDTVKFVTRKEVRESFHIHTSYISLNYILSRFCSWGKDFVQTKGMQNFWRFILWLGLCNEP